MVQIISNMDSTERSALAGWIGIFVGIIWFICTILYIPWEQDLMWECHNVIIKGAIFNYNELQCGSTFTAKVIIILNLVLAIIVGLISDIIMKSWFEIICKNEKKS